MILSHYILTLDFIKGHCLEILNAVDGSAGDKEYAADEILKKVAEIEKLLEEVL